MYFIIFKCIILFSNRFVIKFNDFLFSFKENDEFEQDWITPFWLNQETKLDSSPEKEKDILRIFDSVINISAAGELVNIPPHSAYIFNESQKPQSSDGMSRVMVSEFNQSIKHLYSQLSQALS